jgi:hypothetical protein
MIGSISVFMWIAGCRVSPATLQARVNLTSTASTPTRSELSQKCTNPDLTSDPP